MANEFYINSFEKDPRKPVVSLCIHRGHSCLLLSREDISFVDILEALMIKKIKLTLNQSNKDEFKLYVN